MRSRLLLALSALGLLALPLSAQQQPPVPPSTPPPRSDSQDETSTDPQLRTRPSPQLPQPQQAQPGQTAKPAPSADSGYSSSKSTIDDIAEPTGELQEHPFSDSAAGAVTEMHPWDPHRAAKDVEVGQYYFSRKNYRGAEGRFRDALIYKPNDAEATFRIAQICEATARPNEARQFYLTYLKILPKGPHAEDAHKALEKLPAPPQPSSAQPSQQAAGSPPTN